MNYQEPCDLPAIIPSILNRKIQQSISCSFKVKPKQAWLETLKCQEDRKLGLIDLHPDIFSAFPRIDLIQRNLNWQGIYRFVDWRKITTRPEVKRTSKKMWPQKGTGKARHGDRTAPQFIGGAQVKGPRGPHSYFSILPRYVRLQGLTSAFSVKLAQDDLHFVDDLYLPTDEVDYLKTLIQSRNWGNSVLFINKSDIAPRNIATICSQVPHFTVIPVYGVNVWSLIKYDTVIVTLEALDVLEEKLMQQLLDPDHFERSTSSHRRFRHSNYEPWNEKQNTNFWGNPATHDDYLEFQ